MRRAGRTDTGSGTLSTVFGVGVFLTLLMFCSHVLLNLWISSAVDAVAHDAATDVATSGASDEELNEVERVAVQRAHDALGGYGDRVTLTFESVDDDRVVLRVVAPEINLLPRTVADLTGVGGLDRRIVVEREEPDR